MSDDMNWGSYMSWRSDICPEKLLFIVFIVLCLFSTFKKATKPTTSRSRLSTCPWTHHLLESLPPATPTDGEQWKSKDQIHPNCAIFRPHVRLNFKCNSWPLKLQLTLLHFLLFQYKLHLLTMITSHDQTFQSSYKDLVGRLFLQRLPPKSRVNFEPHMFWHFFRGIISSMLLVPVDFYMMIFIHVLLRYSRKRENKEKYIYIFFLKNWVNYITGSWPYMRLQ